MARVGVGLGLDDGVAGVFVWLCGVRVCHGTSERDGEMLVMRRQGGRESLPWYVNHISKTPRAIIMRDSKRRRDVLAGCHVLERSEYCSILPLHQMTGQ